MKQGNKKGIKLADLQSNDDLLVLLKLRILLLQLLP